MRRTTAGRPCGLAEACMVDDGRSDHPEVWLRRVPLPPLPSHDVEGFPAGHVHCTSSVSTDQPSFREQCTNRIFGRLLDLERGAATRSQQTLDTLGFGDPCGRMGVLCGPR
jgi:hypothetical protein